MNCVGDWMCVEYFCECGFVVYVDLVECGCFVCDLFDLVYWFGFVVDEVVDDYDVVVVVE